MFELEHAQPDITFLIDGMCSVGKCADTRLDVPLVRRQTCVPTTNGQQKQFLKLEVLTTLLVVAMLNWLFAKSVEATFSVSAFPPTIDRRTNEWLSWKSNCKQPSRTSASVHHRDPRNSRKIDHRNRHEPTTWSMCSSLRCDNCCRPPLPNP